MPDPTPVLHYTESGGPDGFIVRTDDGLTALGRTPEAATAMIESMRQRRRGKENDDA